MHPGVHERDAKTFRPATRRDERRCNSPVTAIGNKCGYVKPRRLEAAARCVDIKVQTGATKDTPIGVTWRGERGKLVVTGIDEGSPSAKAGISMGDVVLSINGSAVTSGATAGELVKSAGARVEIVVVRPSHGRS